MNEVNVNKELHEVLATIPNLGYRSDALATEDMGVYINKIGDFFTNKIPKITSLLGISSERLGKIDKKDISEQVKSLLKAQKDYQGIKDTVDYATVRNVETPVMLGQQITMIDIVTKLKPLIDDIKTHLLKDIDSIDTVVSKMIGDIQHRKSAKIKNKFNDIDQRDQVIITAINEIINPSGTKDRLPIKDVTSNISSLGDLLTGLQELNLQYTYKEILLVKAAIKKLYDKTETLYEILTDTDLDVVSKGSLNELSYGLEYMAQYITSSITVFYILNQTTDNTKAMIKLLQRFKK